MLSVFVRRRVCCLIGLMLLGACVSSWSQESVSSYPNRPIKMVVPYPPTGLTDVLGRLIAERLGAALKQPVLIENKPGAGTLLGAEQVARSAPDGYTLLMATSTTLGISPAMYSKPHVDPIRDFSAVAWFGSVNFFLITNLGFPPKNLREWLEHVKRNPGKFNYATSGSGSPHHLFMELLKRDAGLDIQHVPYKGTLNALPDVMSGKVEMMFCDASAALPQIRAGKVHAIATSAAKPTVLVSDVPPVASAVPGFDWMAWQGVVVPAGTSPVIVNRINAAMQSFLSNAEFREQLIKYGMEPPPPHTPEQFTEMIRKDAPRWAAVVKASGARVE